MAEIPRERLIEMFANMRANTDWDIEGDLLWGYFFTHRDQGALQRAREALQSRGYRFVEIFAPELDPGETSYFFLHVERVEHHTVDTLFQRNAGLNAFAAEFGLDSYDGMDVGRVPGPAT